MRNFYCCERVHRPDGHGPRGGRLPRGEDDPPQSPATHRHEGKEQRMKLTFTTQSTRQFLIVFPPRKAYLPHNFSSYTPHCFSDSYEFVLNLCGGMYVRKSEKAGNSFRSKAPTEREPSL